MFYLALLALAVSIVKFGECIYGVVTYMILIPTVLQGSFIDVTSKKIGRIVGYLNGLLGTLALFYLMSWSAPIVLARYPAISKCWVAVFSVILIVRLIKGQAKVVALEHTYRAGIPSEAVAAKAKITVIRSAIIGTATAAILIVLKTILI
jgi:hypothetical protein